MKLALAWAILFAVVWLSARTEPEMRSQISAEYPNIAAARTSSNNYRAEELGFDDLSVGYNFPLYRPFMLSERDIVELRMLYQESVAATLARADVFAPVSTALSGN